jgi:hypothetical protein
MPNVAGAMSRERRKVADVAVVLDFAGEAAVERIRFATTEPVLPGVLFVEGVGRLRAEVTWVLAEPGPEGRPGIERSPGAWVEACPVRGSLRGPSALAGPGRAGRGARAESPESGAVHTEFTAVFPGFAPSPSRARTRSDPVARGLRGRWCCREIMEANVDS